MGCDIHMVVQERKAARGAGEDCDQMAELRKAGLNMGQP